MTFKYKKVIEPGPFGYTKTAPSTCSLLGVIDGWEYIHSTDIPEVDGLEFIEVVLTSYEKEELKRQSFARVRKDSVRDAISNIGDVEDLLADAMKMIEFNMMMTSRLISDVWGGNEIPPEKKSAYVARNQAFLDAVDSGAVTLRGDYDNMDDVMMRLLNRYSEINKLVKTKYVEEMQKVELV